MLVSWKQVPSLSTNFTWHLDSCYFQPNTIAIWQDLVLSEQAKSMRITLNIMPKHHGDVLQTIMNESSCVGALEVTYYHFDDNTSSQRRRILW